MEPPPERSRLTQLPEEVRDLERTPLSRRVPAAVFLVCSIGAFWSYSLVRRQDDALISRKIRMEAAHTAQIIGDRIEANCRILEDQARHRGRPGLPTPTEWRSHMDLLVAEDPSWEAVACVDTLGSPRWTVFTHEPNPLRQAVPPAELVSHFPIGRAWRTGDLEIGDTFVPPVPGGRLVGFCVPIAGDGRTVGFMAGLLRVDALLARSVRNLEGAYSLTLMEQGAVIAGPEEPDRSLERWRQVETLAARDLTWSVVVSPYPGELQHLRSGVPLLVLLTGILASILLAVMSRFVQIARARASEVSRINGRLEREMRERLQAEQSLKRQASVIRESEARFRSVTESANEAIVLGDETGRILSWNKAAERMFGVSGEAAVGRPIDIILPERHRAAFARIAAGAESRAAGRTLEIEGVRADGREIPLELSVSSWTSGGQRFISGMMRDISHRRANEEQLRRLHAELESRVRERTAALKRSNEDLQQFAYVASHDLQEPLRVVSSFTQLLARRYKGKLGAEADEFIGFAVDGCQRMQQLIADLLIYCRVDTAGEFGRVDCTRALEEALSNLRLAIVESGAQIQHGELPVVEGDHSQIVQLFQNLIGNAVKFRGKDPPLVRVSAHYDNEAWTLSVEDNGIGIDPRQAERIFVIFQRLHGREQYKGTGIGLSICKKIVERHGGRIWVESGPGQGSVFRFTLRPAVENLLFDRESTIRHASV